MQVGALAFIFNAHHTSCALSRVSAAWRLFYLQHLDLQQLHVTVCCLSSRILFSLHCFSLHRHAFMSLDISTHFSRLST